MLFLRVESKLDPKTRLRKLEEIDAIAISITAIEYREEVDLALYLAEKAFAKKTKIARKLKYEFILWLAGKRDIKRAMEATAPKEGGEFFVAVFSDLGEDGVLKALDAKKLPLGLGKKSDPLRLERISLSRIK
jgi:tRNA threonylcarbamoyladenosine modification (KEOPS) complex Cgi121 subunit